DGEVATIFVADPAIADFTMKSAGLLYLQPKKVGETNLFGVDRNNHVLFQRNIYVRLNIEEIQRAVKMLFPCENIMINSVNEGVVLRGCVRSASDAEKIYRVVENYLGGPSGGEYTRATPSTPTPISTSLRGGGYNPTPTQGSGNSKILN